jgi:hypothetical protein
VRKFPDFEIRRKMLVSGAGCLEQDAWSRMQLAESYYPFPGGYGRGTQFGPKYSGSNFSRMESMIVAGF